MKEGFSPEYFNLKKFDDSDSKDINNKFLL